MLQLLLKQLGRAGVAQVCPQPLQLGLKLLVAGVKRKCKLDISDRFGELSHALHDG
jgi:hypothetical protein